MDKVLFGDNQFFAVSHVSDEKSSAQAIKFKEDSAILRVLNSARELGINTFMCTTHDRIANICEYMRKNPIQWSEFNIYPCMPYAHKYANAVTELGIIGTIKQYVPGNIFATFAQGGLALVRNDFERLIKLLIDAEMKMFKDIKTPVIFIQNVLVDLILGLKMFDVFVIFDEYIREKYHSTPGYITMNMPFLYDVLESAGIKNPVICSSINKIGFRMSGGKERYEQYLREKEFRPIAMQVLAGGALKPHEAIEYLGSFPRIESVVFGASSKDHIAETKRLIEQHVRK